ncbi:MAG: four helix bundle protein [Terriglobia bacterium]
MQRFTDLKVWQRSHQLVLAVYRLSKAFPADERYGLLSQLRRAVLSAPTNIAEGSKRQGGKDYARFLNISEGSLVETEYLLMVGRDLGYVKAEQTGPLLEEIHEIAAMLHGLRCKVEEAC